MKFNWQVSITIVSALGCIQCKARAEPDASTASIEMTQNAIDVGFEVPNEACAYDFLQDVLTAELRQNIGKIREDGGKQSGEWWVHSGKVQIVSPRNAYGITKFKISLVDHVLKSDGKLHTPDGKDTVWEGSYFSQKQICRGPESLSITSSD